MLDRVRVANKFPGVKARMQPSDSLASFGRGFGSPRQRPTSWGRRLFCRLESATGTCACKRASFGDGSPALRKTGNSRGNARASRVTGPSSSCVPWCNTPPDSTPPRPYFSSRRSTERSSSPSRQTERSASGTKIVFEATVPGPHARAPTLRQSRYRDRRKARYRLGRAHPWPGGICTRKTTTRSFVKLSHHFSPLRPALPGRTPCNNARR